MTDASANSLPPTVTGLGEALFDCFGERRILGGAPTNLTIHAGQLLGEVGGAASVVSRVGDDSLGERIVAELNERGVDTTCLQIDEIHSTGTVQVEVDDQGHPTYDITANAAWDHIALGDAELELAQRCSAVCFGTLAQRSPTSRHTIQTFVERAEQALRFLDVNLRQSYYSAELLQRSLEIATVAKLNDEELEEVSGLLDLQHDRPFAVDDAALAMCRAFELTLLAVTRGARGTVLYSNGERIEGSPVSFQPEPNADTVGAGDACSAGLVFGLLAEWPLADIAELANRMGAFVASRAGATPTLPAELRKSFVLPGSKLG